MTQRARAVSDGSTDYVTIFCNSVLLVIGNLPSDSCCNVVRFDLHGIWGPRMSRFGRCVFASRA